MKHVTLIDRDTDRIHQLVQDDRDRFGELLEELIIEIKVSQKQMVVGQVFAGLEDA